MNWAKEKVTVTGGAGFIGSHLVDALMAKGVEQLTILDNFSRGSLDNILEPRLNGASIRTMNLELVPPAIREGSVVFHLAAKVTGIQYNRTHQLEMMQTNLRINWNMTQAMTRCKPKLYVFVSTACIYPHDAPIPTPEWCGNVCNPEPTNFGYGVAKWVGEQQAKYLYHEYNVPTLIVRFFNAFGPRDYYDEETSHVAPALIRRVMEGQDPLEIWGTGEQTRAFVDARDIAKALVMLAETPDAHDALPVNIGHKTEVPIWDLAEVICQVCKRDPLHIFDTSKPDGYPRRAADTLRLKSLIGWVPDTPIERTIRNMVTDYKARYCQDACTCDCKCDCAVG